ncbi:HAMP domain-containing protein [candidate division KSB1 bacterium]|nr:HAMP domain-containing protein [candidate division KSB1 bacterium]
MKFKLVKVKTLFHSLFGIFLFVSMLPLIIWGIYFLRFLNHDEIRASALFIYIIFLLTVGLSLGAAYYLAKRLRNPLKQLKKSATEIARGNFSHKIYVNSDDEVGQVAKLFNYMTTELRRLNEMNLNEIITEKNKTKTIIKNIADGVIVTDPDNKIVIINSVAEKLFDIEENEAMNQPIDRFIDRKELLDLIAMAGDENVDHDNAVEISVIPRVHRKKLILQAKSALVISNEDASIGIVTVFRDVTREKEIDRMKTELVSMVAHELRSPLTSIAGFSELLLDPDLDKEQSNEYAEIILKESNRLSNLINKFLDISRIESGKSQVNKIPLDLGILVSNILEYNKAQADKKKIKVELDVPTGLPLVNVDKGMIEEVVLNLFSNAVKYSPEKRKIDISLKQEGDELIVAVKDQGYGISDEALPHIFNKFYRVTDNEEVRDIEGSGLGLSLAKEIVELHYGSIWVESELGKGSTFYFSLPVWDGSEQPSDLYEVENELAM